MTQIKVMHLGCKKKKKSKLPEAGSLICAQGVMHVLGNGTFPAGHYFTARRHTVPQ